ncbi:MAG: hypothetical protein OEM84_03095 [Acidimicrobiia bacterium]|nr:hypothetical protein [Acidimicrobiia bacterium]
MSGTVKTAIGTMWIDASGVLWHRLDAGVIVTGEHAKETLKAVHELTSGQPVPAVVDIRGTAFADRAARDGFAGDEETSAELATALIVDRAFSRRLGNLFLRMSKPARPVRMFTSEEEAAVWARTHLFRQ